MLSTRGRETRGRKSQRMLGFPKVAWSGRRYFSKDSEAGWREGLSSGTCPGSCASFFGPVL